MRAYWKGHLRLSLVAIAVELHAATTSASRLGLHQLDKKTGKRIRYEKIVPGKGKVAEAEEEETPRPKGDNVIDLMEALKKSVTGKAKSTAKPRKAARKRARR